MPAPRHPRPAPLGHDWSNVPDRILTKSEVEALASLGFDLSDDITRTS
jgi:hypothetical protein